MISKIIFIFICFNIIKFVSSGSFDECPFYKKAFETAGLGPVYEFVVETDKKYHNKSILTSIKESAGMFYEEILIERDKNIDILQRDGLYGYVKYDLVLTIPDTISNFLKRIRRYMYGPRRSVSGPNLPPLSHEEEDKLENNVNYLDLFIDRWDRFILRLSKIT